MAIPIHFDDYAVVRSNIADFQRTAAGSSLRTQIRYVQRGETVPIGRGSVRAEETE